VCFIWLIISGFSFYINEGPQANDYTPHDQLFLHIDRNIYSSGDTIRFHAYIRDRESGRIETKSRSLFVLLIDKNGQSIDSARFRIENSTASGWLKFKSSELFGLHYIVGFTSEMMNFSADYAFKRQVFITKDSSIPPGSEEKYNSRTFELEFLPEGGTLISGIKQRVAYYGHYFQGSLYEFSGELYEDDTRLFDFKSGSKGNGVFELTAEQGRSYYVKVREPSLSDIRFPLNPPTEAGISLKAEYLDTNLVKILIQGKGVRDSTYFLRVVMNDFTVFSSEFQFDSICHFIIKTQSFPKGISFIRIYDEKSKIVCERPVLINWHRKLLPKITNLRQEYTTGSWVDFDLILSASETQCPYSFLSIAVIDSALGLMQGDIPASIEDVFLAGTDHNLPAAPSYFGLNNLDIEEADKILMLMKPRRSHGKNVSGITLEYQNFDNLTINRKANNNKGFGKLKLLTVEGSNIYKFNLKSNELIVPLDTLDSYVRQILVLPDDKLSRNSSISVDFAESPEYMKELKSQTKSNPDVNNYPAFDNLSNSGTLVLDTAISIEAVTITAERVTPKIEPNKYQMQYMNTSTFTLNNEEFRSSANFEDVLFRMNPYKVDTKKKLVYFRSARSLTLTPALIILDDSPLWSERAWTSSYDLIANLPAYEISSVTFLNGTQGFTQYGEAALGGVVFVTTKNKDLINKLDQTSITKISDNHSFHGRFVNIFRTEIGDYSPKENEISDDSYYQNNPTIYFNNEAISDMKNPLHFRFLNNQVKGVKFIIVNGVSVTNIPFSCVYTYAVH